MTDRLRHVLAIAMIVQLGCGDAIRYMIGWAGWGVLLGVSALAVIAALWRDRFDIRTVPVPVWMFVTLAYASSLWSGAFPSIVLAATVFVLQVLAACFLSTLSMRQLVSALHWSLVGLLTISILFELGIALFVQGPLFPPLTDYGEGVPKAFAWSRGLLFEFGRIQGITGNANLTGMLALLLLITAACRRAAGLDRALAPVWLSLAALMLVLTRSATVLVATVAVVFAALLIVVWRYATRRTFWGVIAAAGAVVIAAVAIALVRWNDFTELLGRDAELTGRFELWSIVIQRITDSPVVGHGWMGYWIPWVEPYGQLFEQDGIVYLQAHNMWLDLAMQVGLVGVVVWVAIEFAAFRGAASLLRDTAQGINAATASVGLLILVAELVQGLAESRPLIELGAVLLLTFALRTRSAESRP